MRRWIPYLSSFCLLGAASLAARPGVAGDPLPCADLAGLRIESTNLLSSAVVPARDGLPQHCRVLGYVRPAVNFEIWLPTASWNGKFYMAGCGGFCGTIETGARTVNSPDEGLRRGYATSAMDSGHWGAALFDGRWAWNNRLAEIDWAERAVAETARVSKTVIEAFYGRAPRKSYFSGCSTGGRMAAMEAQRHPEDFDGVISGAPALDYTGLVATSFAWLVQSDTGPDGKPVFSRSKVGLVAEAVLERCDARDGLRDGIVSDATACDFTPSSLACSAGPAADCLTPAEVKTLERWYAGPTNSRGEKLYPGGVPRGSETYWSLWLVDREADREPYIHTFAREFLRYMAFADDPGEKYATASFDFDQDPPRLAFMSAIYDAIDSDLSAFKARGGKVLMYQGWADAGVTPQRTLEYHAAVEKAMGGRAAVADFYRLFMVPAMGHCGVEPEGPGITAAGFDPLTALERWVEEGIAPDSLLTTKTDTDGKVLWTRPVCPHPQVARYRGTGDPKDAVSFDCTEP
jgi:feruloyl esterase